jgi:hypothetical protein
MIGCVKSLSRGAWVAGGLCALALLLRAARLGESLWYDEIVAWGVFGSRGPAAIVSSYTDPANHILHTLLSWCSVEALGDALGFESALRLPALLFSVGAVATTFALARLALAPRGAAAAAALMAVLPVAVLEGVEARGYSMMIFFSAAASAAFLANLRRPRALGWALYAILCAAGAWSHPVSIFVPAGHAACVAYRAARSRDLRAAAGPAAGILLAAALTVALYVPALPDLLRGRAMYRAVRGDEPAILGPEGWHALLQLGGSWYVWTALPGLALFAIGLARAAARGADPRLREALAVALAGLPVFILAVALADSWMYARFTLFALPGAAVAIAAGLEALLARRLAAGLAAAAILAAAAAADLAARPAKQPLRDAAEYVRAERIEGDAILIVGLAYPVMDLYLGDLGPAHSPFHGADLERQLDLVRPAWVVVYYPGQVARDRSALLESRGYRLDRRFPGWVDWDNGDVLVYRGPA